MAFNAYSVVRYTWEALGILWLIGMAFTKPTVRKQAAWARLLHVTLGVAGFVLIGGFWFQRGWMEARFLPAANGVQAAGAALTIAGCLFAAWARLTLGRNWSGRATVKANHELVVQGPYALVRHPIYTGILVALAGTALVVGEWRCIVGFVVILLAFAIKMSQEEKLMMETFPQAYPPYRQRVKALIPGVF